MLECIHNGEIVLRQSNDDEADNLIEDIIGNWESKEEPDLDSHMEVCGAIFLWSLLDQLYGESLEESDEDSTADSRSRARTVTSAYQPDKRIELAFDVLKTVRAIWGKPSANQ